MRFKSWRRLAIRMRWRRWLGPAICAFPYIASIVWLLNYSQTWIAIVMLLPAALILMLGLLTWVLARIEFYGRLRRR